MNCWAFSGFLAHPLRLTSESEAPMLSPLVAFGLRCSPPRHYFGCPKIGDTLLAEVLSRGASEIWRKKGTTQRPFIWITKQNSFYFRSEADT
jgi:hypothetical protein